MEKPQKERRINRQLRKLQDACVEFTKYVDKVTEYQDSPQVGQPYRDYGNIEDLKEFPTCYVVHTESGSIKVEKPNVESI